jgi:hypothetical protein
MKKTLKQIFKEVLAMAMAFAITVVGIAAAISSLVVTVERDGFGTVFVIWILSLFCWLPLLGFWRKTYIDYFERFFKK